MKNYPKLTPGQQYDAAEDEREADTIERYDVEHKTESLLPREDHPVHVEGMPFPVDL